MEENKKLGHLKLVTIILGVLFALVILPSNVKSVAIGVFSVVSFAYALRRKWFFDRYFFLTNSIVFLLILCTLFYSEDMDYAGKRLLGMASLVVFPFIFSLFTKEEATYIFKYLNKYLWVYIIAVFSFNLFPFIWIWATRFEFSEMLIHFQTVMAYKMGKFSIHPIYLAMHCGAAMLCSFYLIQRTKKKGIIALILGIDLTLLLFLLMYARKGPIIALFAVFSLFILFQYKKGYWRMYLGAIGLLTLLVVAIPKTRERFTELYKIENLDEGAFTSTNIRYTIFNTALDVVGESTLFGYGIGDYNHVLKARYKAYGDTVLYDGNFNSHNQYLSMFLIGGVILFLAFVFMFGMNMIYAIRFDNQVFILLIVFYSIVMLTENILEREDGVIFFAFFLNFFALKSLYQRVESE